MRKLFSTSLMMALLTMTQTAFSQVVVSSGQFDQHGISNVLPGRRPVPNPPRYPEDPRRPIQLTWISLGEERTNKIVDKETNFRPPQDRPVYGVRIVGTNNGVFIRSARIQFRTGQVLDLRELEGRLREGQRLDIRLNGRAGDMYANEIRVVATTESLVGGRGSYRVEVAVPR